jgi:CTP:molybdopterin cytidylyltransferase MocA
MAEHGWHALVLAAGRGPDDPMASTYSVPNKCLLDVAGRPMLARVVATLAGMPEFRRIAVTIGERDAARDALGPLTGRILFAPEGNSAPAAVLAALATGSVSVPLLVTTGDHPLLTADMVRNVMNAMEPGTDVVVGLARAETILSAYPEAQRTFFRLGPDRVSGCNLFVFGTERGRILLERWQHLEVARKRPWRLVAAFGLPALIRFALGRLDLNQAFAHVSGRLRLVVKPVLLPYAEAAIDVDKPADKELAERILARRA